MTLAGDKIAALEARLERLEERNRRLAEEKANLQLVISLTERINPLAGLEDMVSVLLRAIADTIGGTNITLHYWSEGLLHYRDVLDGAMTLEAVGDSFVAEIVRTHAFLERREEEHAGLLRGEVSPVAWTWGFPLLVGRELVGILKIENLHVSSALLKSSLPLFFSHVALLLGNEIRNTARLKALEAAKRWEQVFKHAGWGVAVGDGPNLALINPAFAHMHGWTVEELSGSPIAGVFAPEERPKLPEIIRQAGEKGHITVESAHLRKDGSVFPVLLDITQVYDEGGVPLYRVVNVQDLTARKQADQRLQETVDALGRSNIELERFAYVASHDLQEPVRTVVAFAQMLSRDIGDGASPTTSECLDFIVSGAKRMHDLVQDLLAYSRVTHKDMPKVRIDCAAALEAAILNLDSLIRESGATVCAGTLPAVDGDFLQIVGLFQNLIANGIKFTAKNVPPRIEVTAARVGPDWLFTVADNGIGIAPEYFDQIFVIFRRLHPSSDYPGTGLGLALCKRIVERHGGRIWVESVPGQGSAFHFTLPALDG